MKSAFFEVDNFPHNFGGLVWIKWITGESNVWFVQVVQSGGNGGIMEEKLREEDAGRGEDGKNERGGKDLNFWKCVGKGHSF